ncbi:MAG: hypothetical protein AAGK32_17075, partial [Actinomycetota bacterium]
MAVLTDSQRADYERDGFLVLRGALSDAEICRAEEGFARNPPLDGTLDNSMGAAGPSYPDPGRYT